MPSDRANDLGRWISPPLSDGTLSRDRGREAMPQVQVYPPSPDPAFRLPPYLPGKEQDQDKPESLGGFQTGSFCGLKQHTGDRHRTDHHVPYFKNEPLPEIIIDRVKYPEAAQHIEDAQAAGYPKELTIDRKNTRSNRKESLKNYPTVPNQDRDEYPPAVFQEGGTGASVRLINPADNRGAGK
jgi:Deoxyribonuclease NucA/NucB